ncbi:acyltransferase [Lysobacter sp. ESA13C]|uniref:acyltransferase family protein n=1 Tax=Lysobacter sp. ESA13C TaxID=2862676 RepID=UPI001CBF4F50|nr:acyltransferase [Lysobacter sp. ESA13C]
MAQDLDTEPLQSRLPQLDALRTGRLVCGDLSRHGDGRSRSRRASGAPAVRRWAVTRVALFFVMSAFSLSLTWPRHAASGVALRSFYLNRWFRIAPLLLALTHWLVLAWGCVLFQLWLCLRDKPVRIRRPLGVALLLVGVIGNALLFYRMLPPVPGLSGWNQSAVFYGAMLLGLLLANNRLLVNRATCFLGTISYSLYLVHPFVVSLLYGVFARSYEHLPPGAAYAGCAAISLALAIPAAWLTYRFVEKPGIRLGHRLFARVSARKRAPAGETQGG